MGTLPSFVASREARMPDTLHIGIRTRDALTTYSRLIRTKEHWPEEPQSNSSRGASGNGAIMRLAPLPAFHAKQNPTPTAASTRDMLRQAVLSCRITHGSPLCVDTTRLLGVYLLGLYHADLSTAKERKEHVLRAGYIPPELLAEVVGTENPLELETEEVTRLWKEATFKILTSETVATSGYTLTTLEAALWALWHSDTFEEVRNDRFVVVFER